MKAWIARDGDGTFWAFGDDPIWDRSSRMFDTKWNGYGGELPTELFPDLKPGYKQPIELTATPLGEPARGVEV